MINFHVKISPMSTSSGKISRRIIVGIIGHPSCGKDTVGEYLRDKYGFTLTAGGDLLRQYIGEHNLGDTSRENLSKVSRELRRKKGSDFLMKMQLAIDTLKLAVSGMRTAPEAELLKSAGGKIIAVTAPVEIRYKRALGRGRIGDNVTFEDFKLIEEKEAKSADLNDHSVEDLMAMSDFMINNSGTFVELQAEVDRIMKEILKEFSL